MDGKRICPRCSKPGSDVPLEERNGLVFCLHKGCNYKHMAGMEKFHDSAMEVIEFMKKDSDKDSQNCQTCKESVITVVHDLEAAKSPLEFIVKDTASRDVPSSLSNVSSRSVCESTYSRAITNPCAKFPIFPNREYFCWLNAAVTLLIHSKSLKNYAEKFEHKNFKICTLITTYYRLFECLNATTKVRTSENYVLSLLVGMQDSAFSFLKFRQGCEKGKADSPIFAIRLFLEEFRHIPDMFEMEHFWMMYCQKCCPGGRQQTVPTSKTIIPFQNVQQFNPSAPITFSICQTCGQKMRRSLQFKRRLPETCIYHFEKGGAHCNFSLYNFLHQGQRYVLKGFIQYTVVKEKNHFITWIRDPDRELWLCYNDLHPGHSTFSAKIPNIDPKEIHIMMWERVSDTDDVSEESIKIEAASPSKEMENALMLKMLELKTTNSNIQTIKAEKEQTTNSKDNTFGVNMPRAQLPSANKGDTTDKRQSSNVKIEILEKKTMNSGRDNVTSLENRNRLFHQKIPGSKLFTPPPVISPLAKSPKSQSPKSSPCSQSPKTSRASSVGYSSVTLPSVKSPFESFLSFKQCSSVPETASKVDNKILLGQGHNESLSFHENFSKPQNSDVSSKKSANEVDSESISEKNGITKQTGRRISHFTKKKNSPENEVVVPKQKKDIKTKASCKVSEKDVVSDQEKSRADSKIVKRECNFDNDSPTNYGNCPKPMVQQCDSTTFKSLSAKPNLTNTLHEDHSEHLQATSYSNSPANFASGKQSISKSTEMSKNRNARKLHNAKTLKGKRGGKTQSAKTPSRKMKRQEANLQPQNVQQVVTDEMVTSNGHESTRHLLKDLPACIANQKISTPVKESISQKIVEEECKTVSNLKSAKTHQDADILFQTSKMSSSRQNPIDKIRLRKMSTSQVEKPFDEGSESCIADLKQSYSEGTSVQKSITGPSQNATSISNHAKTCPRNPDATDKALSNINSLSQQKTSAEQSFKENGVNREDDTSLDDSLVSQEALALDKKNTFEKKVQAVDSSAASSQLTSKKPCFVQQFDLTKVSRKRQRKLSFSSRAESESSDERTPKRQCKDISQLPHISKQDIEQKSLQHSSNSVTPLSTILGETSCSGQSVKKRKEQDFAKDRPMQDMDCATTCPPIKQKKNASIEEVDMDDSSLERRPTVMYLRPLENKDSLEHESMELDNQANMTKVMPENSSAKDIFPNDSMKETVSTVDNSPLLQRCISPTPPVLEMSEDTRTENGEKCGSTSNIRETELNTNNNIVEKELGDATKSANENNSNQAPSGRSLRRNTRKDYKSDSIALQTNTEIKKHEICKSRNFSSEVDSNSPIIKKRGGRRKDHSPINKTIKDVHASNKDSPQKIKQCVQSEKFENALIAPISLLLYNSAKKYEKPMLRIDQQDSDKNANATDFEQEDERVLESKVEESEMEQGKFLESTNSDCCILNVSNNDASLTRQDVGGINNISDTLLIPDATVTIDKQLSSPQRNSLLWQKASTEDSVKCNEIFDSTAPSSTGETTPLTKYPPCITNGSDELAGIVKAVSKFSSPDTLETQQDSDEKKLSAQPKPVPDTKDIHSVSQTANSTQPRKRRGRPRKLSYLNPNASTSKPVKFSPPSNKPVSRCGNKRLKRRASNSSQATDKTPLELKLPDMQMTPLLKSSNNPKVIEKVYTNKNNAASSTRVITIHELTAPEISNMTCIDGKMLPFGSNVKPGVPPLINIDDGFKNKKVFLIKIPAPHSLSGNIKPLLTKHTESKPLHVTSDAPVMNNVIDETFKSLATISSQKNVCEKSPEVIQCPPLETLLVGSNKSFPKASETVNSLEIQATSHNQSTFPPKTNFFSKQTNQEPKEKALLTLCSNNDVSPQVANFEPLSQSQSAININNSLNRNQRSGNPMNVTTVADGESSRISWNKDCHIQSQTSSTEIAMTEELGSRRRKRTSRLAINQSTSSTNVERKGQQETSTSLPPTLNQLSISNVEKIVHVINERKKSACRKDMHVISQKVSSAVAEPTQRSSSQSSDSTQQQKETPSVVVAVSSSDSVHAEPVPEFEIDEKEEFLGMFSQFIVSEHDKFIQEQISCGMLVVERSGLSQVNNTVTNMTSNAQSAKNRIVPNNINLADEHLSRDLTSEIPSRQNSTKEGTAAIKKVSNIHDDKSTKLSGEFPVKRTILVPVKSLDVFTNSKKTIQDSQTKEVANKLSFAILPQNLAPNFPLQKNTFDISNKSMQYLSTLTSDFQKEVSQNSQSTRRLNVKTEIKPPKQKSAIATPKLASLSKESLQISSEVPKLVNPIQNPLLQKFAPVKTNIPFLNVEARSVAQYAGKPTPQIRNMVHLPDADVSERPNVEGKHSPNKINLQLHHEDASVENKSKHVEKSPQFKTNCRRSTRSTAGCPPQRFHISESEDCVSEVEEPSSKKSSHSKIQDPPIKSTYNAKSSYVLPTKKGHQCQMSSESANELLKLSAVNSVISYAADDSFQLKPQSDINTMLLNIQENDSHLREMVKKSYSKQKQCEDDVSQVLAPKRGYVTNTKIPKRCDSNKSMIVKPKRETYVSATRNDYLFPSSNMSLRKQQRQS